MQPDSPLQNSGVLDIQRNEDYNGHKSLNKHQIRLVKIEPDFVKHSCENLIQCSLEVVDIERSGEYTALSYCWGKFDPGIKILLNNEVYLVTENLHCALETFRQLENKSGFFIDALCINQNDDAEKSAQVQSMCEVYKKATQVVVFLDKQQNDVAEAFEWIKSAGKGLRPFRSKIIRGVAAIALIPSLDDQVSIYKGLEYILSRPWWRRIWVVQELAVAGAGKVLVHCGNEEIDWEDWDLVIDAYQAAILDPPSGIHLFSWMHPFRIPQVPPGPLDFKLITWDAACALHTARRRYQNSEVDHGLASLLIRFRDFQCSDRRDKIYAILRLSKESENIKPDYSKTAAQVYREAVQDSVKNPFQRLALFSMLDYDQRDKLLPSWCPSFHKPSPKGRPFYRDGFLSAQRHYTIPKFEDVLNGNNQLLHTMTVSGFEITEIASIITSDACLPISCSAETAYGPESPLLDTLRTLCISQRDVTWLKNQQSTLASPRSATSDSLSDRSDYFSQRTNSAQPWNSPDANEVREYTSREDRIYAENWLHIILKIGKTAQNLNYDQAISVADIQDICEGAGRQLVLCANGNYGHVPLSAAVGDLLVVFLGGKVPLCIRKDIENPGCYHLLGDCYIHGYMAGEAIPDMIKDFEAKKVQFTIS